MVWKEVREYRSPVPTLRQTFECLKNLNLPSDWPPMLDKEMIVKLSRRIVLIFFEEWFKDIGVQKQLT